MSANGRLSSAELAPVQGTMQLAVNTASAWELLVDAARDETGVTLRISSPNGAYRSYEMQEKLSGKGNHKYKPGYSVHGTGRCVDINNWASVGAARLSRIAARFGFTANTVAGEPWHYQHNGTAPAVAGDDEEEVEDMDSRQNLMLEQLYAAVTGKTVQPGGAIVPLPLDPNVNWGQSAMVGIQEARKGVQYLIDHPVDPVKLAAELSKQGVGGITVPQLEAALKALHIPTAVQNGQAARDAIVKPV